MVKKKASGIFIFENFIDIFVLLLFSIFGSFILKKWILLGLLIFFIFIIFGLFFALNKYTYFIQNNFKNNKILEKISTFFIAFKKIKKDPYFLGGVLAFSAVALIIQIFFIKLLFYSFNNSLPFAIIFILQPIAILASLLPLSLSGIGIREGAMAILYIDYLPITNSIIVGLTHSFIVAIIMPLFLLPLTILFLLKKN